ncbi:MAG: PEGA domain-containing protein [Deltaproteobacteria bacterium]|nr:PEGA domain-containing protein [Deltaproteobacteria bacterium]
MRASLDPPLVVSVLVSLWSLAIGQAAGPPVEPARVAAVAVTGGPAEARAPSLARVLRRGLERRPGVALAAPSVEDRLFKSVAPPTANLRPARRGLRRASKAFSAFRLPEASRHLAEAKETLAPWEGTPEARELVKQCMTLEVSLAHAERDELRVQRALEAFARSFPEEEPREGAWPPALVAQLKRLTPPRHATLQVESNPSGVAYVDGVRACSTPCAVEGLSEGEHRVVIEAELHFRRDERVVVSAAAPAQLRVDLDPDLSRRLSTLDLDAPLPPNVAELLTQLASAQGVELIILGTPLGAGARLRRLDIGGRTSASAVEVIVLPSLEDATIDRGLEQLITGFAAEPSVASGGAFEVPVWAWIAAGAGAAAATTGIVLRIDAAGATGDFEARQAELTQAEAFDLRDGAEQEQMSGTILIGVGAAAIAGVGAWLLFGPPPKVEEGR